jgi:hypothetical protein
MKTLYQMVYDKRSPYFEIQYVTINNSQQNLQKQSESVPLKSVHTAYRDVENGSLALIFYEGVILFLRSRRRTEKQLTSFEMAVLKEYPTEKYITGYVIKETDKGIRISADDPFTLSDTKKLQEVCRSNKCYHPQSGIYITYFKKIFTSKL